MFNILALETSTEACSVAISKSDVVSFRYQMAPRQHANHLNLMVEDLLSSNGMTTKELNLITFGVGPGSFTGLRIGASAAQALAFVLKIPVFGGCTLQCQAQNALQDQVVGSNNAVLSVIDAKVKKVYWSLIVFEDGHPTTIFGPEVNSFFDFPWNRILVSIRDKPLQVIGDAAGLLEKSNPSPGRGNVTFFKGVRPHAKGLLKNAIVAHDRNNLQEARDINPLYLDGASGFQKMSSSESA